MKKIFFSAIICLVSAHLFGQTIKVADSIPVVGKLQFNIYDQYKPAFKTEKGLVYQLHQDGMPALRPDTSIKYNMPVFTGRKNVYTVPIKNLNPLFPPNKQGEIIIQTPEGPKRINIH